MRSLTDRVVLLTGAAGGIGSATARALAARGARLALADCDRAGLERLAKELPGAPSVHVVDLTDRSALAALVAQTIEVHGELSVVVCNAGLTVHGRFADLAPEEIDRVLEVDLRSVLHLVALALPHLRRASPAHVVLIGSMAGLQAFPFQSAYSAAKFGLLGFGDALRMELGTEGIGVSTLLPGTIATGFLDRAGTHDVGTSEQLAVLMRRFGTSPERVAAGIVSAIRWNRGRVRVGWDSHVLSALQWIAPPLIPTLLWIAARARP